VLAERCDIGSFTRRLVPAGSEQLPIVRRRRSEDGRVFGFLPRWRNTGVAGCDDSLNGTLVRERLLLVQKLSHVSIKPTNLRAMCPPRRQCTPRNKCQSQWRHEHIRHHLLGNVIREPHSEWYQHQQELCWFPHPTRQGVPVRSRIAARRRHCRLEYYPNEIFRILHRQYGGHSQALDHHAQREGRSDGDIVSQQRLLEAAK
jgi:hypothetical protein